MLDVRELRKKSKGELAKILNEERKELVELRMARKTGSLADGGKITKVRKGIARILTAMKEKEVLEGVAAKVVSDRMQKTVVVAVERAFAHPVYKKRVKTTKRYFARDELGAGLGDDVVIEETSPLSKKVRWVVTEVEGKSSGGQGLKSKGKKVVGKGVSEAEKEK
jgi:small subunit ribosomal protein S17